MDRGVASSASVVIDPSLPFEDQFCCAAQQRSRANGVVHHRSRGWRWWPVPSRDHCRIVDHGEWRSS
jgi:hypothetical protein